MIPTSIEKNHLIRSNKVENIVKLKIKSNIEFDTYKIYIIIIKVFENIYVIYKITFKFFLRYLNVCEFLNK